MDEVLCRSCGHRAGTAKGFLSSSFKCFLVMKVAVSLGQECLAWLVEPHLLLPTPALGCRAWVGCAWASGPRCHSGGQSWAVRLACPKQGRLSWLCQSQPHGLCCEVSASSVHLVCTGLKAPASPSPLLSLGMLLLVCAKEQSLMVTSP